jgi:PIN domain nuclease of toxin-antitoxin system
VTTALVLDTSALLAAMFDETGAAQAAREIAGAETLLLTSVNLAEAIAVLVRRRGVPVAEAAADIALLGAEIAPFGAPEAEAAAGLAAAHRGVLSLGDAACLATAMLRGAPVLTADRAWAGLGLPVELRLVR